MLPKKSRKNAAAWPFAINVSWRTWFRSQGDAQELGSLTWPHWEVSRLATGDDALAN